jgi:hypothetical protein
MVIERILLYSPRMPDYPAAMRIPILKPQEIPYDHPDSTHMFQPSREKPFVATPLAIAMYQHETIIACLRILQKQAQVHGGLDYLQVFEDAERDEALWIIEGGAITALMPSDY